LWRNPKPDSVTDRFLEGEGTMDNPRGRHFADEPAAHDEGVPENSGTCEIELDSADCFGIGYSDPLLEENDAKRALLNRFIHLDHLIGFLAEDEGLEDALPVLWDFFECHRMPGAPETVSSADPLLAWRKLLYVWVGFVDAGTGSVLPPFPRLQGYDYDPAIRDFVEATNRVFPDFIQYLKIEDIERLFQELSLLLEIDLRPPRALNAVAGVGDGAVLRSTPRSNEQVDSTDPTISFYQEGEYWKIGFIGNEKPFKHRRGFLYLLTMLQHRGKQIACQNLYHGSSELLHHPYENVPSLVSLEDREAGGYHVLGPDMEKLVSRKDVPKLKAALQALKDEKKSIKTSIYSDFTEREKRVEEIDRQVQFLQKYIDQSRNKFASADSTARSNVRKGIKEAIEAILATIPELSFYISLEPPHKTILTGFKCSYDPALSQIVKWNFGPSCIASTATKTGC
jgi:hypothetical protein